MYLLLKIIMFTLDSRPDKEHRDQEQRATFT
jgi:hypothetical protein